MKDSSCCCLQLPISAVLQWLQFPVIMQLSLIANLSITDCRWEVRSESVTDGNPWCWRAGGEEEQELSQSDLQSQSIHHHLLWYLVSTIAPLNLERMYHFFPLPLPQVAISAGRSSWQGSVGPQSVISRVETTLGATFSNPGWCEER